MFSLRIFNQKNLKFTEPQFKIQNKFIHPTMLFINKIVKFKNLYLMFYTKKLIIQNVQ